MSDSRAPVVVIGAGAAGLVASIFAAGHGPVLVIEKTADGGRKILISGGGRCNILPAELRPERFVTGSPSHLLRGMLRSWPLTQQREFFEREAGIPLTLEAATAKLFPVSNKARDVRDGLIALARRRGVEFQFNTPMTSITPAASGWRVDTHSGAIEARAVILATGGLSVPATGSDGLGLRVAAALGHSLIDTYPALTPITCEPARFASLAGVSLPVRIRAKAGPHSMEAKGGFLFTHRGYSGPAVLDVSHVPVCHAGATLRVSWTDLTAEDWTRELSASAAQALTVVARHIPHRLAERLLIDAGVPLDRRAAELRRSERTALMETLTSCGLPWTGSEGYTKAEVTGGGIALGEVDPRTLESRRHSGLFLCGEMLDAFGPIGGHNFAWAWATGRAAGLGVNARRP